MPIQSIQEVESLFKNYKVSDWELHAFTGRLPFELSFIAEFGDAFSPQDNREIHRKGEPDRLAAAARLGEFPFECLAFYKSIRFLNAKPFPGKWGIFYILPMIELMAEYEEFKNEPNQLKFALEAVFQHERRHFIEDIEVRSWEVMMPFRPHLYSFWLQYISSEDDYEEALANRDMFQWMQHNGYEDVALFMLSQGPGTYGRFQENDLEAKWVDQRQKIIDTKVINCESGIPDEKVLEVAQIFLGSSSWNPCIRGRENWLGNQIISDHIRPPEHIVGRNSVTYEDVINNIRAFKGKHRSATNFHIARIDDKEDPFAKNFKKFVAKHRNKDMVSLWEEAKRKAYQCPQPPGLGAEVIGSNGEISIRVDRGYRARIKHNPKKPQLPEGGIYDALRIGTHQEMGNGK